jgi:hypothetical protein
MDPLLDLDLFNEMRGELVLGFLELTQVNLRLSPWGCHSQGSFKLGLEVGNFTLELGDDLGILGDVVLHIVDIALDCGLDVFGSVCILESVVGIFKAGT